MAVLLALASAVVYGASDYAGGRISRRVAPAAITLFGELTLLTVFLVVVPVIETGGPTSRAMWWGIAGGLAGSAGVLGLYAALSRGSMTVVAPITGVVAAGVPVLVGVALGERPSPTSTSGIVLAVVAVGLIGGVVGVSRQRVHSGTVVLAALVGTAFGLVFISYSRAGDDSGLWPLLTARFGATPLLIVAFVVAWRRRQVAAVTADIVGPGVAIGLLVGLANGLYLQSTREGLLSIVAVVVSLYPASTIVLAAVLDRERVGRSQMWGMALAVVAVALITLGS